MYPGHATIDDGDAIIADIEIFLDKYFTIAKTEMRNVDKRFRQLSTEEKQQ